MLGLDLWVLFWVGVVLVAVLVAVSEVLRATVASLGAVLVAVWM